MNSHHHARLLKLGLDSHPIAATRLLQAYASLPHPSSLTYARRLFDQVPPPSRDPTLWTAMISAYARSDLPVPALQLFTHSLSGSHPNAFLLSATARAVGSTADLSLCRSLHCQVIKFGFAFHVIVATSLLSAYWKCDDLLSARNLFDEMPQRNLVTWNVMISAYTTAGMGIHALGLFYEMRCAEFELGIDEFTVSSLLTACAGIGDLRFGVQIHAYVFSFGFEKDNVVSSTIANMYFRCGQVECAERAMAAREENVMDKLMMINGYVFNVRYSSAIKKIRHSGELLDVFFQDRSVVVSLVTACANLGLLRIGRKLHGIVVVLGDYDNIVLGSALIDMYCKCSSIGEARCVFFSLKEKHVLSDWNSMIAGCVQCGLLEEARAYFDEMPAKNVISWTAMISGYVQCGLPHEGLRLLSRLYSEESLLKGNCYTFASAINACSSLASLDVGKQVHGQAIKTISMHGFNDLITDTALVDMYSKSGSLAYARRVFDRMGVRNVVSWTSMISGYASHGYGLEAIEVLEDMMSKGFKPNEVTFVAILSACSHCGLIKQGMHYFNLMTERYGISPRGDHRACLVDMLGRAGKLEEAWKVVKEMKDESLDGVHGSSILGALLAGCKMHGNLEIGSKVAEEMTKRRMQTSETYIAMSNVYASAEMWDEVSRVREEWRKQSVLQEPGLSQIQIGPHS